MIYTDMKHLARHKGLGAHMDTAIDYLLAHGIGDLVPGRNEVDGDNVYINRFSYTTMPEEEAAFEAHEAYADIHLLAEGCEFIGVTPMERMSVTSVDREADNVVCDGPVEVKVPMEPGKVLIVFPEDAHLVKIENGGPVKVEKAVVKVRV